MSNSIKRATSQKPLEERVKELKAFRTSIYNKLNNSYLQKTAYSFDKSKVAENNQSKTHKR